MAYQNEGWPEQPQQAQRRSRAAFGKWWDSVGKHVPMGNTNEEIWEAAVRWADGRRKLERRLAEEHEQRLVDRLNTTSAAFEEWDDAHYFETPEEARRAAYFAGCQYVTDRLNKKENEK